MRNIPNARIIGLALLSLIVVAAVIILVASFVKAPVAPAQQGSETPIAQTAVSSAALHPDAIIADNATATPSTNAT